MFPYFTILKDAYELTLKNRFLWLFGLFLGGSGVLNFSGMNLLRERRAPHEALALKKVWSGFQSFPIAEPKIAAGAIALGLVLVILMIVVSGLSQAALIWATDQLSQKENQPKKPLNLRPALSAGLPHLLPVITLQILMTVAFLVLLGLLAGPTIYLFSLGEEGRGLVLLLLALAIFLPASLVFSFLNLYGPIAIVLYGRGALAAAHFAFNLLRAHLKESIILAAVLAGLSLFAVLVGSFAVIILTLPLAVMAWLAAALGALDAMYALIGGTILLAIFCVIVFRAAFAAYQNVVWVLAVKHLVKLRRSPEKAEALAPVPAS